MESPQKWNRYGYTSNNPLRFSDPTGHKQADEVDGGVASSGCLPSELACQIDKSQRYKNYKEKKRQNELFPLMFSGSGSDGSWTYMDKYKYYTNRSGYWGDPESWDPNGPKGWDLFALNADRLASHYSSGQEEQFVRDFGLVFAGIPSQPKFSEAATSVKNGPSALPYLGFSNAGLPSKYLDSENSSFNQSHHYAGIFTLGYFEKSGFASVVNYLRDTNNPGDIALGNVAAKNGSAFSLTGSMNQIGQLISSVINP